MRTAIGGGMRYDYAYDSMGRLVSKSASGRKLLAYTYDLNGNRSTMTDVTGKCTGYRYNSLDQLLEITDNGKVQARYDYNGDGTIRRLEVGNSLVTEYAYDVDKNLIGQKTMMMGLEGDKNPLGTLQGLGSQTFPASGPLKSAVLVDNTYTYDNNANRIEKRTLAGLNRFAYDSVNRLVKAEYPTGAEEYRYDKAGNRTAKITAGLTEQYHYDGCNRLTRLDITSTDMSRQTKHFTYDNQGNMLSDGNRQYVYDAMNRLSEVKNADGGLQKNYYDGEGLRAELEENGRLVSFIFDGDRVVSEKDDENTIRYIRGYELISSDSEKARTYYHYACDEMGSITHVTDEAGSILNRYEYDAFGDCTYKDETVANRFGFAGEQFDPVAGMYYLRARFYNPVIGRFIQEDTYYGDGLNLYAYCHNNPVGYVDPSGHICTDKYQTIEYLKKTEGLTSQDALARYRELKGENPGLSAADLRKKVMGEVDNGSNNILNKPLSEWTSEDIQRATDSIHNAQYGGQWYGSKNPIAVTISKDGRIIVSKNNGVPGPKARAMAMQIFGEDVEFVRGGKSSNYIGGPDPHHAEARGIQYMLNNGISTEDARQGISSYSCGRCESKQSAHGIINITGNASDYGDNYTRSYVDNLWILVELE